MLNIFGWVRGQVKAAFLAGLADAVSELQDAGTEPDALEQLRLRLALPAPAAEPDEPAKRRAKGGAA